MAQQQPVSAIDPSSAGDVLVTDKKLAESDVREVAADNKVDVRWHSGVKAQFPWLGFAALLVMAMCISFSVIILKTSHGKLIHEWPTRKLPHWVKDEWKEYTQLKASVALAVTNTVSNLALAIAIGKAVEIAWWRRALKGATVSDLHRSWAYTTSTFNLVTAGTKFNLIALAALAAKIALGDSILLQRATTLLPSSYTIFDFHVNIPIVRQPRPGAFGVYDVLSTANSSEGVSATAGGAWSYDFSYNVVEHMRSADFISFEGTDFVNHDTLCKGFCSMMAPGFGFSFSCTPELVGEDFVVNPQTTSMNRSLENSLPPFMSIETTMVLPGDAFPLNNGSLINSTRGLLVIDTSYWESEAVVVNGLEDPDAQDCVGRHHQRQCVLEPAIIRYGFDLQDTDLSKLGGSSVMSFRKGIRPWSQATVPLGDEKIAPLTHGQLRGLQVMGPAFSPWDNHYTNDLIAVMGFLNGFYDGSADLRHSDDHGFLVRNLNEGVSVGMSGFWSGILNRFNTRNVGKSCAIRNSDPMPWMIEQLNSLMLRLSISNAVQQNTDGVSSLGSTIPPENIHRVNGKVTDSNGRQISQTIDSLEYQTNEAFMWAAFGTTLFCILYVLPSYWGFWQLGRRVTLGPMEIASAFQAPALQHPAVAIGGEVDELLSAIGDKKVRYGDVEGSGKLAVAEAEVVQRISRVKS